MEKVGFWPEKTIPTRRNNAVTATPTSVPDSSGDSSTQRECSHEEYDFMKENLLLYNNARLMDSKKSGESIRISLVTSYYAQVAHVAFRTFRVRKKYY